MSVQTASLGSAEDPASPNRPQTPNRERNRKHGSPRHARTAVRVRLGRAHQPTGACRHIGREVHALVEVAVRDASGVSCRALLASRHRRRRARGQRSRGPGAARPGRPPPPAGSGGSGVRDRRRPRLDTHRRPAVLRGDSGSRLVRRRVHGPARACCKTGCSPAAAVTGGWPMTGRPEGGVIGWPTWRTCDPV